MPDITPSRTHAAPNTNTKQTNKPGVFEERITGAAHECTLEGESPQDCDQLERLVTLVASLGLQPSSLLNAAKRWEYLAVHAGDPKKAPPPPDPLKEQRRDILAAAFVREDSDGDGYVGVEKARQLLKLAGHEVRGHDAELAFSSLESRGTPDEDSFVTAIAEKDDDVALSSIEPQMSLDDLFFLDEHLCASLGSYPRMPPHPPRSLVALTHSPHPTTTTTTTTAGSQATPHGSRSTPPPRE